MVTRRGTGPPSAHRYMNRLIQPFKEPGALLSGVDGANEHTADGTDRQEKQSVLRQRLKCRSM